VTGDRRGVDHRSPLDKPNFDAAVRASDSFKDQLYKVFFLRR
jgi:hypothetical protein